MNVASQEVLQCTFHAGLKPVIFYIAILFAVASIVLPSYTHNFHDIQLSQLMSQVINQSQLQQDLTIVS